MLCGVRLMFTFQVEATNPVCNSSVRFEICTGANGPRLVALDLLRMSWDLGTMT